MPCFTGRVDTDFFRTEFMDQFTEFFNRTVTGQGNNPKSIRMLSGWPITTRALGISIAVLEENLRKVMMADG